jgi:3'-phosphoadenosine 5'-phosphosulfate sulfotransferase (PAPS reductase)/FAD synthetase
MSKRTIDELRLLQNLPLEIKVAKTKLRIREWVNMYGVSGVYVSFSGGKDSTVLLHIVREMYPEIEAVFVNTGLEYPEIQQFVKNFDNVTILRPKMRFDEVIKTYGYPVISKSISRKISDAKKGKEWVKKYLDGTAVRSNGEKSFYNIEKYSPLVSCDFNISDQCCAVMKKNPAKQYAKKNKKNPITAQMTSESTLRTAQWLLKGCNAFDTKNPISNPMSFWTEQDVLRYIKENNIKIASVYGEIEYAVEPEQMRLWDIDEPLKTSGCDRTGCIFCGFGCHLEKESRFLKLKETHPKQYAYCIGGGEFNEQGIWQPSKEGLGMGYVFDRMNEIYGDDFIRYK